MDKKHVAISRAIVLSGLRTMAWWFFASALILLTVSYQHLGQSWLSAAVMALAVAVVAAVFRFVIGMNRNRAGERQER
ncbi:hypothetical protein [uncultured Secundilactobacillus sp.]|uniref:hypothetical protein n=1 Tax=uncultured Secundilactobacillus sp. TaxID=2813935 RepID=UPI00258DC605|nr:hypothetical protein [uncultured Secundilactobacillus sp.]